jgi:hypothetical protein
VCITCFVWVYFLAHSLKIEAINSSDMFHFRLNAGRHIPDDCTLPNALNTSLLFYIFVVPVTTRITNYTPGSVVFDLLKYLKLIY